MFTNLPEMLSAKDIMEILPVSRSGVYTLLRDPTFPTIRLGRRIIVPRDAFGEWLRQNMTGNIELPAMTAVCNQPATKEEVPVTQEAQAPTAPDNTGNIDRKSEALLAALAELVKIQAAS